MNFTKTIITTLLILISILLITMRYFSQPTSIDMRFSVYTINDKGLTTIELKDHLSGCKAEIYSFGALLNAFSVPVGTDTINVIDGFNSVNEAVKKIDSAFQSAKLSPFVCRMNKGQYAFQQQTYKVEKYYLGEQAIHGLLYDAGFEVLSTHADEHSASVGLRFKYNATDKGYPFHYELLINWKLEAGNKLSVKTTVLHHNAMAIPFSDGWHPYFSLGNSIDECELQFDAHQQVEFNADLLPTGKLLEEKRFEHITGLNGISLDNCFVLAEPGKSKCVLKNQQLQLTIQPDSHYPYLQIYTPPNRKSIAIENLSSVPDAFNNKIGLLLVEPNHQYSFTTSYALKVL